jgi:hypothetical protein
MLFGETVAVYCENHAEHTDILCGQNVEFLFVKAGGKYSDHWALKGYHRTWFVNVHRLAQSYAEN